MEPKQPTPRMSPEVPRFTPDNPETWNGDAQHENSVERAAERGHEQLSQPVEQAPAAGPAVVVPTLPVPPGPVVTDDTTTTASSDTPLVAADEDVIEKEWVDKAKQIINATKDDPYRREYEVSRLQADYLEKRYGKKLGEAA